MLPLRSVQRSSIRRAATPASVCRALLHTTPAVSAKRRNNRKAELEAQRAAEVEAALRAQEQLRKLKDTKFLNSLVQPKQLFETTQISQQDAAFVSTTGSSGATNKKNTDGSLKRTANSGHYIGDVSKPQVDLVTEIAPKASMDVSTSYGSHIMPDMAANSANIQADIVRRVMSLDNANSNAVMHYNIAHAVDTFGRTDSDSGSAEVQAAVWTVRINNLEEHLREHRKDHHNRRSYTLLLHKRAKMLKYLKRESLERYYLCLKQLGLTKEMVEGEILIPKRLE